jgi:hypothetical protein
LTDENSGRGSVEATVGLDALAGQRRLDPFAWFDHVGIAAVGAR